MGLLTAADRVTVWGWLARGDSCHRCSLLICMPGNYGVGLGRSGANSVGANAAALGATA